MTDRTSVRSFAVLAAAALLVYGQMAPVGSASADVGGSRRYFDEAQKLSAKGDVAGAVIQLKNSLREDANNLDARFELGVLYIRTGDFESALRELEGVRARGYNVAKVIPPLTTVYLALGRFRDLVRDFNSADYTGDTRTAVLAAQARAQIALQDTAAARRLVDEALKQKPVSAAVIAADAILLRLEQKFADAERQVDAGLSAEPDQSELLVLKGELRQQQQDVDGAMAYFDRAVSKYPRYTRGRVARGMANLARGKYELLEEDVREVLAQEPQNGLALYLRAFSFAQEKKYKETREVLLALPQLLENYPPARYLLAATAYADNQLELARAHIEGYLAKSPGDPTGTKLLAAISQRTGDPARAITLLEPLSQGGAADVQMQMMLAGAYLAVGRSEDAVKLFERGISQDPNNNEAQLALAVSRLRSGATEAGISQLAAMVEQGKNALQASTLLVLTHMQARQFDKALEASDSYIKANPNDANGYNLKGTISLAANDLAAARASFLTAAKRDPKFVGAPLNLAKVEERSNKPVDAQRWYERALEIEPKNLTAHQGLAGIALAANDVDRASRMLERAIALNPENVQPRQQLVDMLLSRRESNRALIAAREFVNAAPADPRGIDSLGRAQLAVGDHTNAIGSYQQLAKQLPENAEAQRRLAGALVAAANTQVSGQPNPRRTSYLLDASAALDRAIAIAPDEDTALVERLTVERTRAGDDRALELARKFVAERPESIARMLVMGDLQSVLQDKEGAVATYRAAWEKGKSGPALRRYYAGLASAGRGAEGLKLLTAWTSQNPTDYESRFLLASAHIDAGRFKEALAETEAMSGVLPDNPVLLNNIAWLHSRNQDPKAFTYAEKAFSLAPEAPDILDTLGWLETTSRDSKRGVELLAKAHRLAPDRPEIGYHYAAALRKAGDSRKAREVLEKSLQNTAAFAERKEAEAMLLELRR